MKVIFKNVRQSEHVENITDGNVPKTRIISNLILIVELLNFKIKINIECYSDILAFLQ